MAEEQYDYLRRAIDVMTAYSIEGDGTFAEERLRQYAAEEPNGEGKLLVGLVSLAGYLTKLEMETKQTAQSHLQDIAAKVIDK